MAVIGIYTKDFPDLGRAVLPTDIIPITETGNVVTSKTTIASVLASSVPTLRTLTINGTTFDLSANRSWTIPTHDAVTLGTPNGLSLSGQVLSLGLASSINAGALSAADWIAFNSKQPAGNYVTLDTVQTITASKTFITSGSSDTLTINHSSGSGIGLSITKGGNGEGLRINKTSGSGNAVTVIGIANFSVDVVVNGVSIGRGGSNIESNTRAGLNSLSSNTTGGFNSALGFESLRSNTTGSSNSAFGYSSLFANVSGINNTGIGLSAIEKNTTGSNNIGLGVNAGRNTISGLNTITDNSIFIGAFTLASANNQTNQIVIGYDAVGLGSNTTVLGNSSTNFGRWWGNLLIGDSTNSGQPLQVTGNMKLTGTLTNGTYTYTLPSATGTLALTSNITSAISGTTNFIPKFTSSNVIGNSQIFDNGTNVGIGTTNPGVLLHSNPATTTNLVTALFTAGATDSNFKAGFANGLGNASNTEHAKVGMWYGTSGNPLTHIGFLRGNSDNSIGMTFNVNNSEYMRINNAGNVLIGTTTDNGAKLQVNGTISMAVVTATTKTFTGNFAPIVVNGTTYYIPLYN